MPRMKTRVTSKKHRHPNSLCHIALYNVPNASGNAASRPGWYTETCVDITALVWTAARGHRKPPVTDLQLAWYLDHYTGRMVRGLGGLWGWRRPWTTLFPQLQHSLASVILWPMITQLSYINFRLIIPLAGKPPLFQLLYFTTHFTTNTTSKILGSPSTAIMTNI